MKIDFTIRPGTFGPKFHWFGYYDKYQFDVTSRYALGREVDFEHRPANRYDELNLGIVDLQDGDKWIEMGSSIGEIRRLF